MRARHVITLAASAAVVVSVPLVAAGPAGAAGSAAVESTAPAGYVSLSPTRVLDTRDGYWNPDLRGGKLTAGQNYRAALAEVTGHMPPSAQTVVPADATAVVVNATVTGGTADSYLTLSAVAGPDGAAPATSSINFRAGQTVANLVTVAVAPGSTPSINVYNHVGSVDVVLDVVGYYRVGEADGFGPLPPTRLVDSRVDGTALGADGVRSVQVAGPELGTADARAVVLSLTATGASSETFLTAYPTGSYLPSRGSNVNVAPGRTVPNQVVVPVGADGKVDIYNHVGRTDVIVDLVGYYGPSGKGLFSALKTPVRQYDSRLVPTWNQPFSTSLVRVGTAPANASAVALNVTDIEPTEPGHLTVFPYGAARPNTSNLNFAAGQTVANSVTSGLGGGIVDVYNHAGRSGLVVDLNGWFTPAP